MYNKIGILGGTGFLGTNISEYFKENNIEYVVGSRRTGVDAQNTKELVKWIQNNNIDAVINLAAQCGGIGLNKTNPADLWSATTRISTCVLDAAVKTGLKKLLMLGTVCSYAHSCPTPFKEEYLMHYGFPEESNASYGVAKLNSYFGTLAYRKQYNINAIFILPVNLYGKHDNFDLNTSHVIPALIKKCIKAKQMNEAVECWGTGSATREFLYAKDAAEGLYLALCNYNSSEPVNLGSGNEISIKNLLEIILEEIDYNTTVLYDSAKPDGQPKRCLDVSKSFSNFGFRAKTNLRDGLRQTIKWYLDEIVNSNHFVI